MSKLPLEILIIDDSPEDREIYKYMLGKDRDTQYNFCEAGLSEQGISMCAQKKFDCILLDYDLPDINGLDCLKILVDSYGREAVSVVMLTGAGNEQIAVQAMKNGAQDYLLKGNFTVEALRHAIHNAIDKMALMRQVRKQHLDLEEKNRELKEQTARLKKANQELNSLVYVVAKDAKIQLRTLGSMTEWIVSKGDQLPISDEEMQRVDNFLLRIENMYKKMNRFLQYCKASHIMEKYPVADIYQILRAALDIVAPPSVVEILILSSAEEAQKLATIFNENFRNYLHIFSRHQEAIDFLQSTNSPALRLLIASKEMLSSEILGIFSRDIRLRQIPTLLIGDDSAQQAEDFPLDIQGYIKKPVEAPQCLAVLTSLKDFWLTLVELPQSG